MRRLLSVRECFPLWRRRNGAAPPAPPFQALEQEGEISLSLPVYAIVAIRDGLRWRSVHNGSHWGSLGIGGEKNPLRLRFPLLAKIRVKAQGGTWVIALAPSDTRSSESPSLMDHALVLLFLFGTGVLRRSLRIGSDQKSQSVALSLKKEEKTTTAAGTAIPQSVPFAGISYRELLERLARNLAPIDRLASLLGKTKKVDWSAAGAPTSRDAKSAGATLALDGIPGGGNTGIGITAQIEARKFSVKTAKGDPDQKADEKQVALLRERFRESQEDFRRVYSRLLSLDPSLSVTVAFQVKVQPDGSLSLVDFKARGNYLPLALKRLESGMAEVLHGISVGPQLAGVVIRGENIFVR
jgi:hypothetical protein